MSTVTAVPPLVAVTRALAWGLGVFFLTWWIIAFGANRWTPLVVLYNIIGIPGYRKYENVKPMETVKLGKKGQMSIPKGILKRLGLEGDVTLLVDTTPEGAIVLRPAAVYPIEIYSDKRIREFDAADRMDAKTAARLARILKRK
jgi:AbrB family looped-hinge helix DNA binding protein